MMKISKIFAGAGEYGTVAVEGTFAVIIELGALLLRKSFVLPIKEDTRAELVERGYTLEEITSSSISGISIISKSMSSPCCLLYEGKSIRKLSLF